MRQKNELSKREFIMNKQTSSWILAILGIWIFISSFFQFNTNAYFWIDILDGIAIAIVGFSSVVNSAGVGWITGIIGCWLIIASFIGGLHFGAGLLWNNLLSGAVVAILGFVEMGQSTAHPQTAT